MPWPPRTYGIQLPPDTDSTCPVICRASSEARKAMALATSSGCPRRRSGVAAADSSSVVLRLRSTHSVSVVPGAMALTRMPSGPSSCASTFVNTCSPPLVVAYAIEPAPCAPRPSSRC